MAEITKDGGLYYYKGVCCGSADAAYRRFRKDYNESQGRNSAGFLQRLGKRKERVHDSGIIFTDNYEFSVKTEDKVDCYQLGLVSGSYTKIVSVPDSLGKDESYEWADWIFRKGSKQLRMVGRKQKTGRTRTGRKRIKR